MRRLILRSFAVDPCFALQLSTTVNTYAISLSLFYTAPGIEYANAELGILFVVFPSHDRARTTGTSRWSPRRSPSAPTEPHLSRCAFWYHGSTRPTTLR